MYMEMRFAGGMAVHLGLLALEEVEVVDTVLASVNVIHRAEQYGIGVVGERLGRDGGEAVPDEEHIQRTLSAAHKEIHYLLREVVAEIDLAVVKDNNAVVEMGDAVERIVLLLAVLLRPYMALYAVEDVVVGREQRVLGVRLPLGVVRRNDEHLKPLASAARREPHTLEHGAQEGGLAGAVEA